MNDGTAWLAPMTRDWLLDVIREMVQGANGVHLRDLASRLAREGVKPVSIRKLSELLQGLGIPVREQLKVNGLNAAGIHWASVLDTARPRNQAVCAGRDAKRRCWMMSAVQLPIPLCAYHRWEVAVGLAPELRDRMPAPPHPFTLHEDARRVPIPGSGRHLSVVYFLALGNRVKIGLTAHLEKRMTALAVSVDSVALTLDGGRDLEAALHHHFSELRISKTEWFRLEAPLSDYMAAKAAQPLP